jgi:GntR family transcriptional regulator/MocR family aminotransferase
MRPSFTLDGASDTILQDQIRKGVIELMRSQVWPSGHRLPSSRTMARLLGVSRSTVTIAYQQRQMAMSLPGNAAGRSSLAT